MNKKMLIVEDNELAADIVSTLFKGLGFETHVIVNGLEVLPYLENNKPDVMILDLELPGMTGDKIYAAIKDKKNLSDIPIVTFTAHRDTDSAGSLPSNLIWAEYMKTGQRPTIVFKGNETGSTKDINQELVDEVAFALLSNKNSITIQMAEYYMKTRKIRPEDLLRQ